MNGTDSMMNGKPKRMIGKQITLRSMAHHTITTKIRKERRVMDNNMRIHSEKMLADSCDAIAKLSRLSQLKPELTGMTIEEVDEFIKNTADKLSAKYEKMSVSEIMIEMLDKVFAGGESHA